MSPRRAKAVSGEEGSGPATELSEHLIDAAEMLIRERPLTSITARDIARTAGVSDGVLYNYFESKNALLAAALARRHSLIIAQMEGIVPRAGSATVTENLLAFGRSALDIMEQMLPLATEIHQEPGLLKSFMSAVHREPLGPQHVRRPIIAYLKEEQRLGRVDAAADPEAAATLLISMTFMQAFHRVMHEGGKGAGAGLPEAIGIIMRGLAPR